MQLQTLRPGEWQEGNSAPHTIQVSSRSTRADDELQWRAGKAHSWADGYNNEIGRWSERRAMMQCQRGCSEGSREASLCVVFYFISCNILPKQRLRTLLRESLSGFAPVYWSGEVRRQGGASRCNPSPFVEGSLPNSSVSPIVPISNDVLLNLPLEVFLHPRHCQLGHGKLTLVSISRI